MRRGKCLNISLNKVFNERQKKSGRVMRPLFCLIVMGVLLDCWGFVVLLLVDGCTANHVGSHIATKDEDVELAGFG